MQEIEREKLDELLKYKELIDTIIEGLNYVNSKLKIEEFDKSIVIFSEMITGINAVISGLGNKINTNIQGREDEYLELIVSAFEQGDAEKIIFTIDTILIPFLKEIQSYCY